MIRQLESNEMHETCMICKGEGVDLDGFVCWNCKGRGYVDANQNDMKNTN